MKATSCGFVIILCLLFLTSCFRANRKTFPSGCFLEKQSASKIVLYGKKGCYVVGPLVHEVMWTNESVYGGYDANDGTFKYFLYLAHTDTLETFLDLEKFDDRLAQLNFPAISVKDERNFDEIDIDESGIVIMPKRERAR